MDLVTHPNYDSTMNKVNKILDKPNAEAKLLDFDQIDMDKSNMEYLMAFDLCSYRMPCHSVLGDRSMKITKKRFKTKA